MPDVISGVIVALVTYVTYVLRWQSYEKIPNFQRNSGKSLDFSEKKSIFAAWKMLYLQKSTSWSLRTDTSRVRSQPSSSLC